MFSFPKISLLIMILVIMCQAKVGGSLQDLLVKLEDESFEVREQASKELVDFDISIDELRRLIEETKNPESKSRLSSVITAKIEATGWVKMANDEIPKRAKACGAELIGGNELLYLVKTSFEGADYLGKYRTDGLAHFPLGEKEQIVNDFYVWVGKGNWLDWEKGNTKMIEMGTTKEGKRIYAARAKMNGGLHMGMLVEGEKMARISWGGSVTMSRDFEVLTME